MVLQHSSSMSDTLSTKALENTLQISSTRYLSYYDKVWSSPILRKQILISFHVPGAVMAVTHTKIKSWLSDLTS